MSAAAVDTALIKIAFIASIHVMQYCSALTEEIPKGDPCDPSTYEDEDKWTANRHNISDQAYRSAVYLKMDAPPGTLFKMHKVDVSDQG